MGDNMAIVRSRANGNDHEILDIPFHMAIISVMMQDGFRYVDVQISDLTKDGTIEAFIVTVSMISAAEAAPYYTIPCPSLRQAEWTAKQIIRRTGPIPEHVRALSHHAIIRPDVVQTERKE